MSNCAFDNGNECSALNEMNCKKCPFRKTKKELIEGRWRATARLTKLPRQTRARIRQKYYQNSITEEVNN